MWQRCTEVVVVAAAPPMWLPGLSHPTVALVKHFEGRSTWGCLGSGVLAMRTHAGSKGWGMAPWASMQWMLCPVAFHGHKGPLGGDGRMAAL